MGKHKGKRKADKPTQKRSLLDGRTEKNKKRRRTRHEKRLGVFAARSETTQKRLRLHRAERLIARVNDPMERTTHLSNDLIEKAKTRLQLSRA